METGVDQNKIESFVNRICKRTTKELERKTSSFISLGIQYDITVKNEKTGENLQIENLERYIGDTPVVLLGGPGTGKSTLLLKLSTLLAEKTGVIPIFVHCGLLTHYDALKEVVHLTGFNEDEQNVLWEKGKLYIIFDGVNETEVKDTSSILKDILQLAEIYPGCRYVVSCRSLEFPIWATTYFDQYYVMPVTNNQMEEQFLKELGDNLGRRYYDELSRGVHGYLLELCQNPLLLSLVIRIIEHNAKNNDDFSLTEIKGKSDIYEKFCGKLVEHQLKKSDRTSTIMFNMFRNDLFGTLSFYMQGSNKVYISKKDLDTVVRNMPYSEDVAKDYFMTLTNDNQVWYWVVEEEIRKSSFFNVFDSDDPEKGTISFIHQSFQEYYAGYYLSRPERLNDSRYIDYLLGMKTKKNWDTIEFASGLDTSGRIIKYAMDFAITEEDTDALILSSRCIIENEYALKNSKLVGDCCIWMLDAFKYWDTPYKYELIYAAAGMINYVSTDFPERLKNDIAYFADKYSDSHAISEYPDSVDFKRLQEIIDYETELYKLNAIHTLGVRSWNFDDIDVVCDYLFSILVGDNPTTISEQVVKAIKSLIEKNKKIHIGEDRLQILLQIVSNKNESPRLRTYTLNTLAEIGEQSAIKIFMDYLLDKSNPYRDSASWSLQELVVNVQDEKLADIDMQDFYYQCLISESDDQTGMNSKGNLVYTLGKLNAKSYIARIKEWMDTQTEAYVQEDAVNAIGCLSGKSDISYFLIYTKSEDPVIRAKAYCGMYKAGYNFSEADLSTIENDEYEIVRSVVFKYIKPVDHITNIHLDELIGLNPYNNPSIGIGQYYEGVDTVINIEEGR